MFEYRNVTIIDFIFQSFMSIRTFTRYDNEYTREIVNYGIIEQNPVSTTFVIQRDNLFYNLVVVKDYQYQQQLENAKEFYNNNFSIVVNKAFESYSIDQQRFSGELPFLLFDFTPGINLKDVFHVCRENLKLIRPFYKYAIILGILKELDILHKNNIVHGELIPKNILLDTDFHPHLIKAPIANGQMSIYLANSHPNFCPPEAREQKSPTTKFDIYTFGGLLFQMITLYEPFEDTQYPNPLEHAISNGVCDTRFENRINRNDKLLYQLIYQHCWVYNPDQRDSAEELITKIKGIIKQQLSVQEINDLDSYLNDIQEKEYPEKYIQGTFENIQKSIKYGFFNIDQTTGIMKFIVDNIAPYYIPRHLDDYEKYFDKFIKEYTVPQYDFH